MTSTKKPIDTEDALVAAWKAARAAHVVAMNREIEIKNEIQKKARALAPARFKPIQWAYPPKSCSLCSKDYEVGLLRGQQTDAIGREVFRAFEICIPCATDIARGLPLAKAMDKRARRDKTKTVKNPRVPLPEPGGGGDHPHEAAHPQGQRDDPSGRLRLPRRRPRGASPAAGWARR